MEPTIQEAATQLMLRIHNEYPDLSPQQIIERHIAPALLGPLRNPWEMQYHKLTDGTGSNLSAALFILFVDPEDGEIKVLLQEKAGGKIAASGGGFNERKKKEQPRINALREAGEECCDPQGFPIAVPDIGTLRFIDTPENVNYDRTLRDPTASPVAYWIYSGWLNPKQVPKLKAHVARMQEDSIYRKACLAKANNELTGLRIVTLRDAAAMTNYLHKQESEASSILYKDLTAKRGDFAPNSQAELLKLAA